MIEWSLKKFEELSPYELYKIIQLRIEIFAVEQNCVYQDCDDRDQGSFHFTCWGENKLIAYTRIMPPGLAYSEPSIGRVITSQSVRGTGLGKELMERSILLCRELFGNIPVTISAQLYLKRFYESLGFVQVTEPYEEDHILHIKMHLPI